jgi:hypothetical protein
LAWLEKLPQFQRREKDTAHILRLDPISLFLIFYALTSFIAIIVFTNTPIVLFGPSTDLGTLAANYLLITAPVAAFAPLLVGSYLYDYKQLGPILRPVTFGKGLGRQSFPDVAIIGMLAGLLTIAGIDYVFTYGGFTPTLSFWNTLTNKIAYADGGVFEEFIFRLVIFGTVNRFPGLGKVLLGNPALFFVVAAPLDSFAFVLYHLKVYAASTLALNIVFLESYVLCGTYRVLKYPLWVVMIMHAAINWTSTP